MLAKEAKKLDLNFLDSPVSGGNDIYIYKTNYLLYLKYMIFHINLLKNVISFKGINAAKDGTLTFMVGGSKENFELVKTLLNCMGSRIIHCGDVGMGQAAKLCNNMLLGISMIGTAEAFNLGQK